MTKIDKAWGTSEALMLSPFCEVHEIVFRAGERCSVHNHTHRHNGFYVIRGKMLVQELDGHHVESHELGPRDWVSVPPGVDHVFISIEDGVALEVYWPEFPAEDINRK